MGIFFARPLSLDQDKPPIAVIGTGPFGIELVKLLTLRGYRVIVGSRNPGNVNAKEKVERANGEIMSYSDAFSNSLLDIVVIAVPSHCFVSLPNELINLLENKIVIDVSNRPLDYKIGSDSISLAERLQNILPDSRIVKAFNTLSAYELQNCHLHCNKEIPVCSDDKEASLAVIALAQSMGFTPVDRGKLANALEIEEIPLKFFPRWKWAGLIALAIFAFAFIVELFRLQICPNIERIKNKKSWNWQLFKNLLLDDIKTAFALASITMLSICYLPGIFAGFIQLYRGTRYQEFPKWLVSWLSTRKQLGLIALVFGYLHVLMVIFTVIEHGLPKEWMYFTQLGLGSIAIGLLTVLGITSLPSVSRSLTWRETNFLLSSLGWMSLLFSLLHMVFARWRYLISNRQSCIIIPGEEQIFVILPLATVILKLIIMLPCIGRPIQRIRNGYERLP